MTRFTEYEVGGCVRDRLLGRTAHDIDVTCVMDDDIRHAYIGAEAFDLLHAEIESKFGVKIFVVTPQFFTIRAATPDGVRDYVLARREGPYSDSRRPDWVVPGSLKDDLARRDFTMNAIARWGGNYIDPFGGVEDIARRVVRAVGDPNARLIEDPLRVLRAYRFAITLGFRLDHDLEAAAFRLDPDLVAGVSKERRQVELQKMFQHDRNATLDDLCHNMRLELRDAMLHDIELRPCFTFKGLP